MSMQKKILTRIPKNLQWIENSLESKPEENHDSRKKNTLTAEPLSLQEKKSLGNEKVVQEKFVDKKTTSSERSVSILEESKSSYAGLRQGWVRATFIVQEEHLELLKTIAYWDKTSLKDVVNQALSTYLENKKLDEYRKHIRR